MWFLPSFNRAEKCKAVIDQINSVGCTTKGLILVNGGDQLEEYQKILLPFNWEMHYSEINIGVCGAMNWFYNKYPDEDFYGLICDDEYVYTPGWDRKLAIAAGKTRIAHANDGWQSKQRIHGYATYGGDIVRQCGWWAPPGLWHWYFDDAWEMIANDFRLRRFQPDIRCEHKHYMAEKSEKDLTYEAGEKNKDSDATVFHNFCQHEYPKLKQHLKEKFTCYNEGAV